MMRTASEGASEMPTRGLVAGTNPSGEPEAWLAMIPEPGTGCLLLAGLLDLAVRGATAGRSRA
jgi:hypothetical protein